MLELLLLLLNKHVIKWQPPLTHLSTFKSEGKGNRFIVLYPPKCSHDLPPLVGLYTRKPFQSCYFSNLETPNRPGTG